MPESTYDLIVIGGGPAGVAAALSAKRAGARTTIVESLAIGGEVMNLDVVEEFPAAEPMSGADAAVALMEQVYTAEVEVLLGSTVSVVDPAAGGWTLATDDGELVAHAVLLATGAAPIRLPGMPNEDPAHPSTRGLFSCAACDAQMYRGRSVAVAGGGDTGVGAAALLARYASRVVVFERERELTSQDILSRRIAGLGNVEYRFGTEVVDAVEEDGMTSVRTTGPDGQGSERFDGVMLAVGLRPRSDLAAAHATLDARGAVAVGPGLETSAPGLFAAGDVRSGSAWRAAAAWGDGLVAARSVLRAIAAHPR